jgi:hypothetical protein
MTDSPFVGYIKVCKRAHFEQMATVEGFLSYLCSVGLIGSYRILGLGSHWILEESLRGKRP